MRVTLGRAGSAPPDGADPFAFNPFTDARRILGVSQPILGFALFAGGGCCPRSAAGCQHGTFVASDARVAIPKVREALSRAALEPGDRDVAERDLDEMERAVADGDEASAGTRLERLVGLLRGTGALAASGAALVGPLTRLAQTLGPLGARVLTMLPG